MPRGEKYSDEIRYRAFALLTASNNVRAVAKKLNLPESTVRSWKKEYEANPDQVFAEVRALKKREYAFKSFLAMDSAMEVLMRRIGRAAEQEDVLDELCEAVAEGAEDITQAEKKAIYSKFSAVRVEDISKLCMAFGVLHDKMAAEEKSEEGTGGPKTHTLVFANPEEAAYAQ